ncbi:BrnA antitoxin family protein [Magnetococcales bacterium HHB-1]
MKDEYDFSEGKRGAILPSDPEKVRVTIQLDRSLLHWFKEKVVESGGGDYHEMINDVLKTHVSSVIAAEHVDQVIEHFSTPIRKRRCRAGKSKEEAESQVQKLLLKRR